MKGGDSLVTIVISWHFLDKYYIQDWQNRFLSHHWGQAEDDLFLGLVEFAHWARNHHEPNWEPLFPWSIENAQEHKPKNDNRCLFKDSTEITLGSLQKTSLQLSAHRNVPWRTFLLPFHCSWEILNIRAFANIVIFWWWQRPIIRVSVAFIDIGCIAAHFAGECSGG